MTTREEQRASRWAELRQAAREQWWIYLLIAASLTMVFNELDEPRSKLLLAFGSNLLIAACIGTATTVVYVFAWGTVLVAGGPLRRAMVHGVSIVVAVLVGTEVALQGLRLFVMDLEIAAVRQGIWRVGGVVTAIVMLASIAYDRLRERARAVELREQQTQHALLRAQIESLQARVNPHFLFNALNTVASLVEEEPEQAIEAIERLSALLRYSLEGARQGRVALRRELDSVQGYLALERLRFGERLRSRVEVAPGAEAVLVPPFLLQPLVENAVKHGIASRRDGGQVELFVELRGERILICIEDDGPGRTTVPGTRVGHATLQQRLELLYGDNARFDAGPGVDGGYRVEIELPRTLADEPSDERVVSSATTRSAAAPSTVDSSPRERA